MRFLTTLLVVLFVASTSNAQRRVTPTVMWQARSCIGEVGFANPEECIAMAWVHKKRALQRNVTMLAMVRAYSVPMRVRPTSRPWLWELSPNSKPSSWPRNLRWSMREQYLDFLFGKLRGVVDGSVQDPCPDALHYGGPMDPVPTGFELTECIQGSRQRFYKRIVVVDPDDLT